MTWMLHLLLLMYLALSINFNVITTIGGEVTPANVTSAKNKLLFSVGTPSALLQNWTQLFVETFDATREGRISKMLIRNAGIYNSRVKAKKLGLQRTVLISVVSLGSGKKGEIYKDMLKNWLCYTAHYDFKPVVYYLSQSDTGLNNRSAHSINHAEAQTYLDDLRQINRNAVFVDYPIHLFWSLLTQKTGWGSTMKERGNVDFLGSYPSFSHHGALVMLVPILEVLKMGFSTVYVDIDIAFVKDPIPFMTLGNSDVAVSAETRKCQYTSQMEGMRIVDPAYMGNIEPNTGTMLIRATNQGLKLMEKFLLRLVNVNKANDQPYFNPELGNVRITSDCQYLYGKTFDENILFGKDSQYGNITNAISRSAGDRSDNSSNREDATMCYLPGLLFQNGFMAFTCSGKEKSKEEFLLRMNRYARLGSAAGTTSRQRSSPSDTHLSRENKKESFDNGNIHSGIQHSNFNIGSSKDDEGRDSRLHSHCMSGNDEDFVAPLIVHANYCGTKKTCMRERGLWLLESYTVGVGTTSTGEANLVSKSYCKAYNKADTKYGRPHWAYQLDSSELKFRKMLETMNVSNVVKFGRQAEVFIVDNPESSPPGFNPLNKGLKVLRGIPNIATLDRLLWPEIRDISSSLSNVMFVGREIMDLTNVTLPSIAQDNITFEEIFASYKRFERSTDLRTVSKALPGSVNMTEMDSVNLYRAEPQNETSYLPVGQQYWERKASQFAAAEIEVNRTYKIELNIKRTAGIYHDKEKSMSYGLENTILLYVLAYDDIMNLETLHDKNTIEKMTVSDDREIKLASAFGRKLRRFLLSMERYGLNPLLYVSPSVHYGHVDSASASHNIHRVFAALLTTKANTSNDKERNSTERVPHFEIAYSYPIPLCFSFFRPLTEWVDTLDNQHHCSFTGEVPTDIYFGVMTTFIPALEILITGHDVIFIDLGVTMLQDPIPHLAANYDYDRTGENGIPDFSFIKEPIGKRDYCLISEFNFDTQATSTTQNNTSSKSVIDVGVLTKKSGKHVSERVQPNLSLVRLKSSNISISIMRKWINEIVRRHDRNGRAALDFEQLGMTETFNCNGQLQRPYTSHASFRMGGKESKEFREGGRYCYYNGLSFQAYEVMNHCHKKNNFTEHSANSQFFDTDTYISTASAYELKKYTESTQRTVTAEERLKGYGYEMVAVMAHQGPSTASYYDIESKADYYGK